MYDIETDRLLLRRFELEDLDVLYPILSDPLTMTFWPAPFSREGVANWLRRSIDRYETLGPSRMAVILRETNELIGDCGIMPLELDGSLENDLGYIIHHPFWRRGYGAEAAAACKSYGLDTLKLDRICANMATTHIASRRVAEKIGMSLEKEFYNRRNRDILTCLYSVSRSRREE